MPVPSPTEIVALQRNFWQVPKVCAAALVLIHTMPKPEAAWPRFLLTAAYFGALLHAVWHIASELPGYLNGTYAWKWEDCGSALERSWRKYVVSVVKVSRIYLALGGGMIAGMAIRILGLWITPLEPLRIFGSVLFWISAAGVIVSPRLFRGAIEDLVKRRKQLKEERLTARFETKKESHIAERKAAESAPAVVVRGQGTFTAGGYDWTWPDFYKNGIVFGQAGTGKTACVLNALLDGLLASSTHDPALLPGGLILDPKGDFRGKIEQLCRQHGREADLVILDPANRASKERWNPFDSDDDDDDVVLQLAGRFVAVMQSTGVKTGQDSFWLDSAKQFVTHALDLLRLTNAPDEPPSFPQILQLARSREAIAARARRIADDDARADLCLQYLAEEWSQMATETRSGIQAHITNMVDAFTREPYATTFSGKSTIRVSDIADQGRILYLYMPIAEKEHVARIVCTFVKLAFHREVLRRPNKPRPTFFLCDEFQSFLTSFPGFGDADFFERSRQSNHANLVATQNLPALTKQLEKDDAVHNLLGNCAVKLFLRNTDRTTNEYASKLFGEDPEKLDDGALYHARRTPDDFTRLEVPAPAAGVRHCEAILHLASRQRIVDKKLCWKLHTLEG